MAGDAVAVRFFIRFCGCIWLEWLRYLLADHSLTVSLRSRSMDLSILELQNARERDLDDWATLFERADRRFKYLGGGKPEGANLWILEARWDGGGGAA